MSLDFPFPLPKYKKCWNWINYVVHDNITNIGEFGMEFDDMMQLQITNAWLVESLPDINILVYGQVLIVKTQFLIKCHSSISLRQSDGRTDRGAWSHLRWDLSQMQWIVFGLQQAILSLWFVYCPPVFCPLSRMNSIQLKFDVRFYHVTLV